MGGILRRAETETGQKCPAFWVTGLTTAEEGTRQETVVILHVRGGVAWTSAVAVRLEGGSWVHCAGRVKGIY